MAIYAYPHTTQPTPQLADFVMQKCLMKVTTGLVRAGYMLQHVLVAVKIVFFKRSIVWLSVWHGYCLLEKQSTYWLLKLIRGSCSSLQIKDSCLHRCRPAVVIYKDENIIDAIEIGTD